MFNWISKLLARIDAYCRARSAKELMLVVFRWAARVSGTIIVLVTLFFGTIFIFPNLGKYFGNSDGKGKNYDYEAHQADVVHLDQGWGEGYRHQYYFTPQGSQILPLDIALALEGPGTTDLIFGQNGLAVKKFGYLAYPKTAESKHKDTHSLNPYGLPIGFTVDGFIEEKYQDSHKDETPMLGMNCAACHTSDMSVNGRRVRIEGNQALGDFMGLLTAIDTSLAQTLSDSTKFKRFEARFEDRSENKAPLRARLKSVLLRREAWQRRNTPDIEAGHGRVDAFGVIFNQVVGRDLHLDSRDVDGNVKAPNAPVSYPVLWDTPHMGRVQWNGSANNKKRGGVLGRNFGQVLGVFGDAEVTRENINLGHCSTVKRRNLDLMDYWIRSLNSPKWSDPALENLLPSLDSTLMAKGAVIYDKQCSSCHSVVSDEFRSKPAKKKTSCDIPFTMVDVNIVKTDPQTAKTGIREGAKAGVLEGLTSRARDGETMAPEEPYANILREVVTRSIIGSFQTVTCDGATSLPELVEATAGFGKIAKSKRGKGHEIGDGFDYKPALEKANQDKNRAEGERDPESECDAESAKYIFKPSPDHQKDSYHPYGYRARPLNGIWASAPYLHNGSVPTLHDMLLPPSDNDEICPENQECRPDVFYVGSPNFDPVKVGYDYSEGENLTRMNTNLPGNGNGGHLYGTKLSPSDKAALLEYLKSL